jgi:hypothetical protein|tara:strand:- start:40 stop:996 length:957 start_codon:yes stop_codon:yes gene_type:complete
MKNIAISLFMIIATSHANGSISITESATPHYQVGDTEMYYAGREATVHNTILLTGTSLAVGWEVQCYQSVAHIGDGGSYTNLSDLTIADGRNTVPSGWTSWNTGNWYDCDYNWVTRYRTGLYGYTQSGIDILMTGAFTSDGYGPGYMWKPEGEGGTPIVIDVNGDGFDFTSISEGALFDIDADNVQEQTAWTEVNGDDAFLFLDYYENGVVDGGHELFGDHATLLSGEIAPNGYVALAELDMNQYGGNEDGVISKKDDYFNLLAAWNDLNKNGVSEPSETMRLKDIGIIEISIEPDFINWVDEHGNTIGFASLAYGKL